MINSFTRFGYLISIYVVMGLMWGFLNVASMQMILTVWDVSKSRPIVQISIMMFSLGAFATSTSCRYFLSQSPTEIQCQSNDNSVGNSLSKIAKEQGTYLNKPSFFPV